MEDRRYIVCLNEDEARKDAADREAIVAALREQLRSGDKSLVGNKGYRRYLGGGGSDHFEIDEAKIAEDARYDGKWVLRTNTDLDSAEVALQYKQLSLVEQWFRSCKTLLQTRPIYHRCDETIRGHVFCSFLALVLRQELESRLEERGHAFEWADVIADLDRLQMVEVEQEGKRFLLRSDVQGRAARCSRRWEWPSRPRFNKHRRPLRVAMLCIVPRRLIDGLTSWPTWRCYLVVSRTLSG